MGQRHGGGVGLPPRPEEGDVLLGRHPLRAGHDRDHPGVEGLGDPEGGDLEDLGVAVVGVGLETGLAEPVNDIGPARPSPRAPCTPGPRALRSPAVMSMSISRAGGVVRDLAGQVEQLVGLLAHGRHDQGHVVAPRADSGPRGRPRSASARDRRPTFLRISVHDQRHPAHCYRRPCRRLPDRFSQPRNATREGDRGPISPVRCRYLGPACLLRSGPASGPIVR